MHVKGIRAEEYIEEARTLFKEMEIQWDLEELERIRVSV
jgi:hypothetical protein